MAIKIEQSPLCAVISGSLITLTCAVYTMECSKTRLEAVKNTIIIYERHQLRWNSFLCEFEKRQVMFLVQRPNNGRLKTVWKWTRGQRFVKEFIWETESHNIQVLMCWNWLKRINIRNGKHARVRLDLGLDILRFTYKTCKKFFGKLGTRFRRRSRGTINDRMNYPKKNCSVVAISRN